MTQDLTHAAQVLEETENRAKAIVNFPNRRKASIHRFKNLSDSQAGKKKKESNLDASQTLNTKDDGGKKSSQQPEGKTKKKKEDTLTPIRLIADFSTETLEFRR